MDPRTAQRNSRPKWGHVKGTLGLRLSSNGRARRACPRGAEATTDEIGLVTTAVAGMASLIGTMIAEEGTGTGLGEWTAGSPKESSCTARLRV